MPYISWGVDIGKEYFIEGTRLRQFAIWKKVVIWDALRRNIFCLLYAVWIYIPTVIENIHC